MIEQPSGMCGARIDVREVSPPPQRWFETRRSVHTWGLVVVSAARAVCAVGGAMWVVLHGRGGLMMLRGWRLAGAVLQLDLLLIVLLLAVELLRSAGAIAVAGARAQRVVRALLQLVMGAGLMARLLVVMMGMTVVAPYVMLLLLLLLLLLMVVVMMGVLLMLRLMGMTGVVVAWNLLLPVTAGIPH